jgi:hypothetical protein
VSDVAHLLGIEHRGAWRGKPQMRNENSYDSFAFHVKAAANVSDIATKQKHMAY